jgi:hypothetical protein
MRGKRVSGLVVTMSAWALGLLAGDAAAQTARPATEARGALSPAAAEKRAMANSPALARIDDALSAVRRVGIEAQDRATSSEVRAVAARAVADAATYRWRIEAYTRRYGVLLDAARTVSVEPAAGAAAAPAAAVPGLVGPGAAGAADDAALLESLRQRLEEARAVAASTLPQLSDPELVELVGVVARQMIHDRDLAASQASVVRAPAPETAEAEAERP